MTTDKSSSRKRRGPHAAKPKARQIAIGDHVLCGSSTASTPGDWFLGVVLWAGKGDFLIDRSTMNGQTWREVVHQTDVRAVGTIAELVDIRAAAREAVQELCRLEHEATEALGRARDAKWRKIDELAAGGLAVIPPDFGAIDRAGAAVRAAVHQADAERFAA